MGGIDLMRLPFDRALNLLYFMVMRNRDEKDRAKVEGHLTKPLAGEYIPADDANWGEEAQGAGFLAALQAAEVDKKKTTKEAGEG